MSKAIHLIRSLRWAYFFNWYSYFLGYFIVSGFRFDEQLLRVIMVFVAIGPIFYSGIYFINDIHDRDADKLDNKRKNRALASGVITVVQGKILASVLLIGGLVAIFFSQREFIFWAFVLLAINLFYTFWAKKIPFLEFVVNTIPHSLRFYLGTLMAGYSTVHPLIAVVTLATLGVALLRRKIQISKNGHITRPVLKRYSRSVINVLLVTIMMVLFVISFLLGGIDRGVSLFFSCLFALLLIATYYRQKPLFYKTLDLLD